jgi:hypothetical protein
MLDREVDDVENFDDMGIDAILVDEAHEYKHLGFATAMQRGVKGVDPSYSKKAQGVYLKTQAVLEKNNGRNVIFATGTPISNTAAEIWTFMRYLMPADTMKEYGIYYFDDFVRNFGNLQQMLEFTTSGKFKENNRFAGYVNLPELVRIWSGVADTVLTKEAGGVSDKIPDMETGKAIDIYLPQSKALRSVMKYVKATLEEYEKMSGKEKKENSHIPLTMYGIAKAAAVDVRLVLDDSGEVTGHETGQNQAGNSTYDDPNSKTNEAVRQTLKSLEETKSYKGTVAIFADNYQNKRSGFNLYEDIRRKLIEAGVPENEIIVMKSGMTVKKKLEIFDKVNRGEVRVIMGSTFTLGTGVNIQERLHTLIHVDAPNRPMDYTQRNGRILRQGNLHKEMGKPVRVLRFGVEDSLDVTAYQRLKTKGAIADSIMNGKQMMANSMENRMLEEEEDVFGDTVAQLSGSEYAMLKNQAEKDVRKYEAKRKQYEADQTYVHNQIPKLEGQIKSNQKWIADNKKYLERVEKVSQHTGPLITIGKKKFADLEAMADYIKDFNKSVKAAEDAMRKDSKDDVQVRRLTVNVGGIDFEIKTEISFETKQVGVQLVASTHRDMTYSCPELGIQDAVVSQSLLRNAMTDIVENVISGSDFRERIERGENIMARNEEDLRRLRERDGKPFEFTDELQKAHERYEEYTELMKKELEEKEKKYAKMDAEVDTAQGVMDADEEDEDGSDEGMRFRMDDDVDQTETFAFKNWFGDWENDPENASKVVDENGKPLVLYHGTNLSQVNRHKKFYVFYEDSHFGTIGQAMDVTRQTKKAMDFHVKNGIPLTRQRTEVYPVYLNIRNPKRVSDVPFDEDEWDGSQREWWDKQVAIAKAQGYDGLVYLNEYEDRDHPADSWIAFYPEQVKSATENIGTFDPDNPDIRFRLREDEPPVKTKKVYKLMRLGEDGLLYPLFIDAAAPTELGVWYDADSPSLDILQEMPSGTFLVDYENGTYTSLEDYAAEHGFKAGKFPPKEAINDATANGLRWVQIEDTKNGQRRYGGESRKYWNLGINGSGTVSTFAMRPGWHAGSLPSMRQIGKGKDKNLRDDNFVWVEGEVSADVNYQQEADRNPDKDIPTHIPENGYYMKATNANAKASQADRIGWYVAGAFKPNRIISDAEARSIIDRYNAHHPNSRVEYDYERESGNPFTEEQAQAANARNTVRLREGEAAPTPRRTQRRTASQQQQSKAYAQRQWRRAHVVAEEAIRLLGLEDRVTVMDFPIGLKGRQAKAKGWYDTKTGKIVVVLNNHRSPEDVFKTILHEGVAHYGLRQLFGEHFDTFLDEVYTNATPEIRAAIDRMIENSRQKNEQTARREATEEYLALLAEDTDFDNAMRSGWWQKIKNFFLDMLHKLGFGEYAGPALTDNELRYILWRSHENLQDMARVRDGKQPLRRNVWNPFKAAEDIVMQEKLQVGNFEPVNNPSLNGREKESRQAADSKQPAMRVVSMEPRNEAERTYVQFKERYGDAVLLMNDGDNYFALGEDALKMERLLSNRRYLHGRMENGRYVLPLGELDMALPVLVRAGNRIAIAEAPDGNTVRDGEPDVEWIDERFGEDWDNAEKLSVEEATARINELSNKYHAVVPIAVTRKDGSDKELLSAFYDDDYLQEYVSTDEEKHNLAEIIRKLFDKYGGGYVPFSKKIVIFADELPANLYEHTFFHENIHALFDQMNGNVRENILYNYWVDSPNEVAGVTKKEINAIYAGKELEERLEEFFVTTLARCMELGRVDMFETYIDDLSDKKTLDKLFNDIGYDKGREAAERNRVHSSVERGNSKDQRNQLQGSVQDAEEENVGLRFRSGASGGFTSARAEYEAKTAGGAFKFRESWQDSMLALKDLQDAIAAESGEEIEDYENAYLAENRMHGKSKNEAEYYDRNYYQPLKDEVHKLVDYLGEEGVADPFGRDGIATYQTADDYLKAKHGLERNQVFAFREAAKQKAKEVVDEQKRQLQQDADDGKITTDDLRKELKQLDENFGKTVQDIIDAYNNDNEVLRLKRVYESGLLTYSELLEALVPLRKSYVMRAEPKTDDEGNVVSDNYYDEHVKDYGGLSELMAPEEYATIEALREMASLTVDPVNKRELYKRVRDEEERVFKMASEEAMKAVDAIEVDAAKKEMLDNRTMVPIVYQRETEERRKHIQDLWSRINDATKKTLQTSYEGGMMSREQYNNVRAMFDYYVPLRGWEENNADDVYDYVAKRSAFSPSVKKAYGRASKADSPLATIGNMAVSQIIISNKNLMRQHFLNMVLNHPSSLISVSEKWYVRLGDVDGETVWEEREPDIKPGMTADEIASVIETFNEEMRLKQEQGDAIPAKGKLHLNLHATKAQKDEHVIEVQRNGKVYKLYINGNPRAAQALNGTNITDGDAAWMQKLSRAMAANFTSRNPAFVISNLSRDFTMAAASVVIKENTAYSKRFAANAVKVLRPRMGRAATKSQHTAPTGLLPSLMRKYLRDELDPNDETERYFQEFMDQGGETGFTNMLSVEKFKSKMEKEFKKSAGHEMDLAKAFGMMADTFEFYNRCAEDATRFIVYMTSRQMGKSVVKSIADAKDVTLNFNRKGAGGMGNATFRNVYIFVNPAIQALSNMFEMLTKHKLKFTAVTLSWVAAGAMLPILNTLMLNLLGGDDDKDSYWDLPDYIRKNNAVFWVPGTHTFVTIPLAQEFRVFYGMGELASAMSMGHTPDSWGKETLSSFMDLLPVNPTGAGGDLLVDFMPTPLQPIVQARDNVNFTGYPIYRDNQGNKYEPTWQKAYHGTPSWMVKASKLLNEATGGNDHYQGWIDGTLTNPALWNHMLQGYLGGMYSFLSHSAGVVTDVASGELPKMYEVPVVNRFINVPMEREKKTRLGNEYYDLVEEHNRMQNMMAKYRKDANHVDPDIKETAERYTNMGKEIDKMIDWERNGKTYEPKTPVDKNFEKRYRRYKKIHDYKRDIEKVLNGKDAHSEKAEHRVDQLLREMSESLRNINEDFESR